MPRAHEIAIIPHASLKLRLDADDHARISADPFMPHHDHSVEVSVFSGSFRRGACVRQK
ncbi:hypothetical protein OG311_40065 (plasmid) [Streptomyces sp. NBC_01343]|uniref:hypothetical protein n=1 Tax=Streptomyces sp. NBC_01343 TaxID=2903832 RepID=UPI002E0F8A60|nr:hypothetical protein OG311_40065 [Streptomyces sp. NBC_01343]